MNTGNTANTFDNTYYRSKKDGSADNPLYNTDIAVSTTPFHSRLSDKTSISEQNRSIWSSQRSRNPSKVYPLLASLSEGKSNRSTGNPDKLNKNTQNNNVSQNAIESSSFRFSPLRTFLIGLILGLMITGIPLVVILTIWLTKAQASSTNRTTCTSGLCWNPSAITVFGTGVSGSTLDRLYSPYHLAFDSSSTFYVADTWNNRVQKFNAGSTVAKTVAGQPNSVAGSTALFLNQSVYIQIDTNGNLYVADSQNHRVQYFTSGTMIGVTIAGTGVSGAALNELNGPRGLALDSSTGTLYISDTSNHRIMCYTSGATSGIVVAGGNGAGTLNNQLNNPLGIYLDVSSNSLFIANSNAHNIIRWTINASTWTLVAGNPYGGAGTISSMLFTPSDVTFDPNGNMYVADTNNHRIQLFAPGAFNGTTIAGSTSQYGSATLLLFVPRSVALDSALNLYVVDTGNSRIQKFQRY